MYAQVEKTKENKSRAVANSVVSENCKGEHNVQFIDNRKRSILQAKIILGNTKPIQRYGLSAKLPVQKTSKSRNRVSNPFFSPKRTIQRNGFKKFLKLAMLGGAGAYMGATYLERKRLGNLTQGPLTGSSKDTTKYLMKQRTYPAFINHPLNPLKHTFLTAQPLENGGILPFWPFNKKPPQKEERIAERGGGRDDWESVSSVTGEKEITKEELEGIRKNDEIMKANYHPFLYGPFFNDCHNWVGMSQKGMKDPLSTPRIKKQGKSSEPDTSGISLNPKYYFDSFLMNRIRPKVKQGLQEELSNSGIPISAKTIGSISSSIDSIVSLGHFFDWSPASDFVKNKVDMGLTSKIEQMEQSSFLMRLLFKYPPVKEMVKNVANEEFGFKKDKED